MKKILTILNVAVIALFIQACGGSSVEVDPNMKSFMDEIQSSKSMVEAVVKFASNPDMETDLDYYELTEPTVKGMTETDGNKCYEMNVKHGMIDSDCVVCWKDGKVESVTLKEI